MRIIDAHVHIGDFGGWANVGISADGLVNLMDEFTVERSVVSAIPNELTLEAVRRYPERLVGLAWVNPWEGERAVEQVRVAVEDWGFSGIKLHPLLHAFLPNDDAVHPIMEEARAHNLPVFIHCGHPPFSLPWSIGELAESFPDVRIVMVHMGHGHGVYIQGSIDTARKHDNIWLETSGMPMHTKIMEAYETVGADRVMYGSDIPFHHPSVELQRMRVSGLDESQLSRVLGTNVAALLGL